MSQSRLSVFVFIATALAALPPAHAEDPEFPGALPSNETASHWGLGVGVGTKPALYQGVSSRAGITPMIKYDGEYLRFFGNALDLKLPSINQFQFALRAKYALDGGYKASDSSYLQNMDERKNGLWLGGVATWKTEPLTLSAQWMKAPSDSKGQEFGLNAQHAFRFGRFQLIPNIGILWHDKNYVDYYYGVQEKEASATRPAYIGDAATDISAAVRVNYVLRENQLILLDVSDTYRGKSITNSPLVDKTTLPALRIGYLYQF